MLKIKRALISVSDKTGIVEFAKILRSFDVEIISTGGTAKILKNENIDVIEMSDYTGFPEILDGRVKTLHPKIHGGLLSLRDNLKHMKTIEQEGIGLIDMVVVNLYPFKKTIQKEGVELQDAIENIDIGGPSMLRSAAKNYRSVAVVSDSSFYLKLISELKENNGSLCLKTCERLAIEVFKLTSSYDAEISRFLGKRLTDASAGYEALPATLELNLEKITDLRYGENPHQKAALYKDMNVLTALSLAQAKQLHGKELSFNNYMDLNTAFEIIRDFELPVACIIKHNNPTGVAQNMSLAKAFRQAFSTDPLSAFGGIIGLNRRVDEDTAKEILKSGFMECVLAQGFDVKALSLLKAKKNLRLLEIPFGTKDHGGGFDIKKIQGGYLVQEADREDFNISSLQIVTKKKPTKKQVESLLFAWKVVKHVKSNAIVLAKDVSTVGIGMGQTSRVDSVFMAVKRAQKRSRGAVLASDAFLPKEDNVVLAKKAGIQAIIQPGGSIEDKNVISAADRAGIVMVFTGFRHFKH
jgi:phosphoribosylaminoimidazolecarboxamide formyltransferase/IMP cyclohydrolase